jgi:hypothetical protein
MKLIKYTYILYIRNHPETVETNYQIITTFTKSMLERVVPKKMMHYFK